MKLLWKPLHHHSYVLTCISELLLTIIITVQPDIDGLAQSQEHTDQLPSQADRFSEITVETACSDFSLNQY